MTNNKGPWILLALAVGVLALSFFAGRWTSSNGVEVGVGAPGTRAGIEEYIPYIKYNEGYYSLLGITTTATITSASSVTDSLTVGSAGTAVSKFVAPANCTIIANANTISASSSKQVDCAISGLVSGDTVFAVPTTTISSSFQGVKITAVTASSTSGYATLTLQNETGTTFTWTGTASTSIKAFGVR